MKQKMPLYFKPLLWEYKFSSIDLEKAKRIIIMKALNYGDLRHWRWIAAHYGVGAVRQMLASFTGTAVRPPARALAELVFSLPLAHDSA